MDYKEIAKKYNITEKQAKEMDEQYWMEYVLGNVYRMEKDSIILQYLGSLRLSMKNLMSTRLALIHRLPIITKDKYKNQIESFIKQLEYLIELKKSQVKPRKNGEDKTSIKKS